MTELSQSADRIGDVVGLINTIAGQTNLARRSTPPSRPHVRAMPARASRSWPRRSSCWPIRPGKATNEIATQIANMQSATQDAVIAIQEIAGTINKMSEISGAIAAAVEQQGATTKEISRNVMEAAKVPRRSLQHHRCEPWRIGDGFGVGERAVIGQAAFLEKLGAPG